MTAPAAGKGKAPKPPAETREIDVKVLFSAAARAESDGGARLRVRVAADGSDSLAAVKAAVAAAAGGALTADDLQLSFGPCDRKMGRQFVGDPTVDEAALRLADFSVLPWLQRFPHWALSVRLLPPPPPPPGVAIKRAAAAAEKKDPDRAVADARARGEIPKLADLPAPWGAKPGAPAAPEDAAAAGYAPARYPPASSPLVVA